MSLLVSTARPIVTLLQHDIAVSPLYGVLHVASCCPAVSPPCPLLQSRRDRSFPGPPRQAVTPRFHSHRWIPFHSNPLTRKTGEIGTEKLGRRIMLALVAFAEPSLPSVFRTRPMVRSRRVDKPRQSVWQAIRHSRGARYLSLSSLVEAACCPYRAPVCAAACTLIRRRFPRLPRCGAPRRGVPGQSGVGL